MDNDRTSTLVTMFCLVSSCKRVQISHRTRCRSKDGTSEASHIRPNFVCLFLFVKRKEYQTAFVVPSHYTKASFRRAKNHKRRK